MKIGNLIEQLRAERQPQAAERVRTGATAAGGEVGATDSVALSSTSRQLAASESGAASGDFDAEKVERIRNAIQSGRFEVDAGKVADGMIGQAAELLGAGKKG